MVRARVSALTPREREVFELVIRGDTNKQVARALGCTERTIKAHRHRVMEKMQVQTLAELVSLAERVGVLGGALASRAQPVDAPASHVGFQCVVPEEFEEKFNAINSISFRNQTTGGASNESSIQSDLAVRGHRLKSLIQINKATGAARDHHRLVAASERPNSLSERGPFRLTMLCTPRHFGHRQWEEAAN